MKKIQIPQNFQCQQTKEICENHRPHWETNFAPSSWFGLILFPCRWGSVAQTRTLGHQLTWELSSRWEELFEDHNSGNNMKKLRESPDIFMYIINIYIYSIYICIYSQKVSKVREKDARIRSGQIFRKIWRTSDPTHPKVAVKCEKITERRCEKPISNKKTSAKLCRET